MHKPDNTTTITISRDGEELATVTGEFELLRWFHRRHSYSLHHAVTLNAFLILDVLNLLAIAVVRIVPCHESDSMASLY